MPKIKIEIFTKFFYPRKYQDTNANTIHDSDSDDGDEPINGNKTFDVKSIDGSSLMSTSRNREITN
jgi:hypothetical protein